MTLIHHAPHRYNHRKANTMHNTITSITAASLLTTAFLLTGCQTPVAPPAVAADTVADYPRVDATGGLDTVLVVREAGVSIQNSDLLRVSIPVRNTASETKLVQYRLFFFDDNGVPHNTNPGWTRGRIPPGTEIFMTGNSLRPAADFRLQIRPQR